ncbi:MAG: transcriptional regulator [Rickettsiales bacterium]|nr:transcriptional regulator [Rickettsiales bacterium]
MKLSKKIIYAIESVIDIALHSGVEPVQNIEIAKRQGIPKRYLEQTLQSLVKNKILIGSRGPKGGYRLAKEKRKIKLSDIMLSVNEYTKKNSGTQLTSIISKKIVDPLLAQIYEIWINELKKISVEDICKIAQEKGIYKNTAEKIDFVI